MKRLPGGGINDPYFEVTENNTNIVLTKFKNTLTKVVYKQKYA